MISAISRSRDRNIDVWSKLRGARYKSIEELLRYIFFLDVLYVFIYIKLEKIYM